MYDVTMRTTLTLDADVAERLRRETHGGRRRMKKVVNDFLRKGLNLERPSPAKPFKVEPHSSGFLPGVDPARLNQMADDLEADAVVAKISRTAK